MHIPWPLHEFGQVGNLHESPVHLLWHRQTPSSHRPWPLQSSGHDFFAAVLSGPSFLARALEGLAVALPVGFGRALVRALLLLAGFAAPSWFALARAL